MKKKIIVISLVLFFVFAFQVKAASLNDLMLSLKSIEEQIVSLKSQIAALSINIVKPPTIINQLVESIKIKGIVNPPQPVGESCVDNAYITKWGSLGVQNGQFNLPTGIAISTAGNVLVSDAFNKTVQKFNPLGSFLGVCNSLTLGHFNGNYGLTMDSSNNFYFSIESKIKKMSYSCSFLKQWAGNVVGSNDVQFNNPNGLASDSENHFFVADTNNNRVQKFINDYPGNNFSQSFVTKWGSLGSGDLGFNHPSGVAVDPYNNDVYVTDSFNKRIKKFNSNGDFLFTFGWGVQNGANQFQICSSNCQTGISGSGNGQFNFPNGIATDQGGYIYVTDLGNHKVSKFNSSGNYISSFGGLGSGNGQFNAPNGIATDKIGNVYVVDTNNRRVQKFGPSCPTSTYVVSCTSSSKVGNADGNSTINTVDANIIKGIAGGTIATPANKCCVDPNNDGFVTAIDSIMTLRYFTKMPGSGNAGKLCSSVN